MRQIAAVLILPTVAMAAGAGKVPAGACSLIPSAAIQRAFGEPIANAKPLSQIAGELSYSHCFYSLPTFTNSISLSLTGPSPADADHNAARELWQRWFHGAANDADRDAPGSSEEREAAAKAAPVPDLGDEAFWVHSFVGNLYVLKGSTFLRISIGGKLTDAERQARARALAVAALRNLDRRH